MSAPHPEIAHPPGVHPAGAPDIEFFGTHPDQLAQLLGGTGRARIPWRLIRRGLDPFAPGLLEPGALRRLVSRCGGSPVKIQRAEGASTGVVKLLLGLRDNQRIETVILPCPGRTTICLSSQVGCGRGCTFCLTATLGLVRSLSAAEMVAQACAALAESRRRGLPPVRNLVFMGMGEPLDNSEAVRKAVALLTDPHALGLGPRRITLSTVGTSPRAIRRLRELPVGLAWSLHTADPALRRQLIPTAKHTPEALRAAFAEVLALAGRRALLFVEMALIAGVNDSLGDAAQTAELLAVLRSRVRVNILPLNRGRAGFAPAPAVRAEAYRAALHAAGYRCLLRRARGADIGAACGQLALRD